MVRIALFAMLMAVSAPTLSSLLAAACGDAAATHCHAQPKATHHLAQKCGYCMVQADLPAAPPPGGTALVLVQLPRAVPEFHAPAPAAQHVRLAPPSRAPPSA
ncbi:DUF2946 family protein [Pseudoduganella sp. OTU4001]|uniref:DUF2946 family protein n=1 Tax=Pseudoduganella sp. OTU4001 TaxID=3043854 RepID=UPI00313CF855